MNEIQERFILVKQTKPTHWLTMPDGKDGFVSIPLCWEVIDRGVGFIPWVGNSADKILARFVNAEEAAALLHALTH